MRRLVPLDLLFASVLVSAALFLRLCVGRGSSLFTVVKKTGMKILKSFADRPNRLQRDSESLTHDHLPKISDMACRIVSEDENTLKQTPSNVVRGKVDGKFVEHVADQLRQEKGRLFHQDEFRIVLPRSLGTLGPDFSETCDQGRCRSIASYG